MPPSFDICIRAGYEDDPALLCRLNRTRAEALTNLDYSRPLKELLPGLRDIGVLSHDNKNIVLL